MTSGTQITEETIREADALADAVNALLRKVEMAQTEISWQHETNAETVRAGAALALAEAKLRAAQAALCGWDGVATDIRHAYAFASRLHK